MYEIHFKTFQKPDIILECYNMLVRCDCGVVIYCMWVSSGNMYKCPPPQLAVYIKKSTKFPVSEHPVSGEDILGVADPFGHYKKTQQIEGSVSVM